MKFLNQYSASFDKPKWEKTPDGFMRCRARLLAERIMPYVAKELGKEFENMFQGKMINMVVRGGEISAPDSLRSLEGVPAVARDHTWLTPNIAKQFVVGAVAGAPVFEDGYLVSDLLITDPDTIKQIEENKLGEISAAYSAETVFKPGTLNGQPYDAEQRDLRYNHIAIIPPGHGRAGMDVRILNSKLIEEEISMSDQVTVIKVQLKNTGKFIQVMNEDDAKAVKDEGEVSSNNLEKTMNELKTKTGESKALAAEIESLKGELSTFKAKLDELLADKAVEGKAMDMLNENEQAGEIIQNAAILNEDGSEDEKKKEEIMNSLRPEGKFLYGENLYATVLNAIGVDTAKMSKDAMRGAFSAQAQIANSMKGKKKSVVGAKLMNGMITKQVDAKKKTIPTRDPLERMGFKSAKK